MPYSRIVPHIVWNVKKIADIPRKGYFLKDSTLYCLDIYNIHNNFKIVSNRFAFEEGLYKVNSYLGKQYLLGFGEKRIMTGEKLFQ